MNKQEQIEEMAKIIDELYNVYDTTAGDIAEGLYNTGYRKGETISYQAMIDHSYIAEIERLKAENEELTKVVSSKVYDLIDNAKEIADAREAWEQQAKIDAMNELKEKALLYCRTINCYDYKFIETTIDELIKEYENDTL